MFNKAERDLKTLIISYQKERSLYPDVPLPAANPTPNTTTPVKETKPDAGKVNLSSRR